MQNLQFTEPWKFLTEKEKNYAYFLYKASWAGSKIVLHQSSYEAPIIFSLFQLYFACKDLQLLEQSALDSGITQEEWKHFIAYVGGFYGNLSNFFSFGDMKFVP